MNAAPPARRDRSCAANNTVMGHPRSGTFRLSGAARRSGRPEKRGRARHGYPDSGWRPSGRPSCSHSRCFQRVPANVCHPDPDAVGHAADPAVGPEWRPHLMIDVRRISAPPGGSSIECDVTCMLASSMRSVDPRASADGRQMAALPGGSPTCRSRAADVRPNPAASRRLDPALGHTGRGVTTRLFIEQAAADRAGSNEASLAVPPIAARRYRRNGAAPGLLRGATRRGSRARSSGRSVHAPPAR